ncbi:CidA/LrgA family protein [Arenibacter sp. 6A1]|uniref:CidA/LrgA family protein n=1 Tax=Arenibacter sp. 6A1 TaxID=2720391 RepID=UPI00144779D3|nr:CidA/LrgA family protein [Arenibacter sp. 6A1]NKI25814.1 CidA/LrgA family protein [Arenibacter sp. 6A1]
MVKSLLYIFSFLVLGEFLKEVLHIPIAGNIVGMFLIFFALKFGLIKLSAVKPASDKLLKYLVLFFIPYGVGLLAYFELIQAYWLYIAIAVVVSAVITLYLTAIILQKFGKNG